MSLKFPGLDFAHMNYFKRRALVRRWVKEQTGINIPQNYYKKFFDSFKALEHLNPEIQENGSKKYTVWQNIIYELDRGKDIRTVIIEMDNLIKEEYEKQERLNYDYERGVSAAFK